MIQQERTDALAYAIADCIGARPGVNPAEAVMALTYVLAARIAEITFAMGDAERARCLEAVGMILAENVAETYPAIARSREPVG
jgi:hypothetical protein